MSFRKKCLKDTKVTKKKKYPKPSEQWFSKGDPQTGTISLTGNIVDVQKLGPPPTYWLNTLGSNWPDDVLKSELQLTLVLLSPG